MTELQLVDKTVTLRTPLPEDGAALWTLVRDTGVLDLNSAYAYFLLGDHFAETSIVAEHQGEVVGFISGYLPPQKPDTLFIWQVGVAASMRKQGLALQMLLALLKREACQQVNCLHTTVTPSNKPSEALFTALAKRVNGTLRVESDHFKAEWFPTEGHEPESLFIISPIEL